MKYYIALVFNHKFIFEYYCMTMSEADFLVSILRKDYAPEQIIVKCLEEL